MKTNIDQLKQDLESKFQLKLFCDLAQISVSHDALLQVLESVYQSQFEVSERLVFYSSHEISDDLLIHLYETTNFLDISNWFVLICAPNHIGKNIKSLCNSHSQDPVPFQFLEIDLAATDPIKENFRLPKSICSIPWNNVEIRSNGDITPCCMSTGINYGNVQFTKLQDAFDSEIAKKLRADFLAGLKPRVCQNCWNIEDKNLTSIRLHNIKRTKKKFLLQYLKNPQIATVDIKFNNTCNFKCRICNSASSSAFAQEEHKFKNIPLLVQDNWGENDQFLDQFEQLLPHLDNIDMYGGEPFLIKKFDRVLQMAVQQGHSKNIRLHYNSNGSVWPKNFLTHWPHFKAVDIHFSIDAIGAQFDLQRGGTWTDVEENILKLKNLNLPNLSISIMPTISIMNIFYIDQVYDWATKHGFQIFVSYVRGNGLELKHMTNQAKSMVLEKYKNHPWSEIQNILTLIKDLPDSDGREFSNRTRWFDQIRQENFAQNHPEIAKAMNYLYNN